MNNCIIVGSGRSGSSMLAGTLAMANYFMGTDLLPARDANPKGFYEDREVNDINETILDKYVPLRRQIVGIEFFRTRPLYGHRWLARVPLSQDISSSSTIVSSRIQSVVACEPYCFKDPRFSYTLPVWRPFLKKAVFICVFRHPAATANSMLYECRSNKYNLSINFSSALEIWSLMYRHVIEKHSTEGPWLFVHYDQLFTKSGLDNLEDFTGAVVNRAFPDSSLNRASSAQHIPPEISAIYKRLCGLAKYEPLAS